MSKNSNFANYFNVIRFIVTKKFRINSVTDKRSKEFNKNEHRTEEMARFGDIWRFAESYGCFNFTQLLTEQYATYKS